MKRKSSRCRRALKATRVRRASARAASTRTYSQRFSMRRPTDAPGGTPMASRALAMRSARATSSRVVSAAVSSSTAVAPGCSRAARRIRNATSTCSSLREPLEPSWADAIKKWNSCLGLWNNRQHETGAVVVQRLLRHPDVVLPTELGAHGGVEVAAEVRVGGTGHVEADPVAGAERVGDRHQLDD